MPGNDLAHPIWSRDYPELARCRLVAKPVVREATTLSDSGIDRQVRAGWFPEPVLISGNRRAWRASEVLAWLKDPPAWRKKRATRAEGHTEPLCG